MHCRPCDRCTDKMILIETGKVLVHDPPKLEREWWCGCGYTTTAEPLNRRTIFSPTTRELWEELNGIS